MASNDKLRKSRIDILWEMFKRENIDYPELIWEDIAYQIDHRKEKRSRREDYQEYGLPILKTMLTDAIKQSESYQMFIKYSTGQTPPKKSRGKDSKCKKTVDDSQETVDVSEESKPEPEPARKKTSIKEGSPFDSTDHATKLAKSISKTEAEEAEAARKVHATHTRIVTEHVPESIRRRKSGKVKIQSEVPHTQSPSMLSVPVSVIFEPAVLTPVQESPSIATATTLPPLFVSTTPSVPQQTKTPIPTPTIITDASTVTTAILESEALSAVQLRVAKLEKDVFDLKKMDLSTKALAALKTQVPSVVDNYLGSKQIPELPKKQTPTVDLEQRSEKSALEILKIKREQAEKKTTPKFTIKSTDKAALAEYDLKSTLYQSMHANKEHDDDDDDDDEGPSAGLNQGKQTKRRRTKESESSKKPSFTKETLKGKAPSKGSKTGKSASAKEPVEEPIAEVVMDDAGDNVVVLDQPEQPWFYQMISAIKDPLTFNDLMATPIDFSNIELEYHFQECFHALTDRLDWNNLEGDRYPFDLSKPLPLQGHPRYLIVVVDYFFNNDLEYLKSSYPERTYTTSIIKTKASRYEIEGIEDMVPTFGVLPKSQLNKFSKHNVYSIKKTLGVKSVSVKKLHGYGHLEEIMIKRDDRQLYKFKEGDFVDLHMNEIEDMLLLAI
ncbi:hypothetical protein Tco_1014576 [Tanacetum coccineum]